MVAVSDRWIKVGKASSMISMISAFEVGDGFVGVELVGNGRSLRLSLHKRAMHPCNGRFIRVQEGKAFVFVAGSRLSATGDR